MGTPGLIVRGVSLSGGPFLDRVSKSKAYTRSLSGPGRAGASKNLGAFSSKASTEANALG